MTERKFTPDLPPMTLEEQIALENNAGDSLTAGARDFKPDMHPRGKDGKFIKKFGFVKFLLDGKMARGQVVSADNHDYKTGKTIKDPKITIRVEGKSKKRSDATFISVYSSEITQAPADKARLNKLTIDDLDNALEWDGERSTGWGYNGVRQQLESDDLEVAEYNASKKFDADDVDAIVVARANDTGMSFEDFSEWLNSRGARYFSDEVADAQTKDEVSKALDRYLPKAADSTPAAKKKSAAAPTPSVEPTPSVDSPATVAPAPSGQSERSTSKRTYDLRTDPMAFEFGFGDGVSPLEGRRIDDREVTRRVEVYDANDEIMIQEYIEKSELLPIQVDVFDEGGAYVGDTRVGTVVRNPDTLTYDATVDGDPRFISKSKWRTEAIANLTNWLNMSPEQKQVYEDTPQMFEGSGLLSNSPLNHVDAATEVGAKLRVIKPFKTKGTTAINTGRVINPPVQLNPGDEIEFAGTREMFGSDTMPVLRWMVVLPDGSTQAVDESYTSYRNILDPERGYISVVSSPKYSRNERGQRAADPFKDPSPRMMSTKPTLERDLVFGLPTARGMSPEETNQYFDDNDIDLRHGDVIQMTWPSGGWNDEYTPLTRVFVVNRGMTNSETGTSRVYLTTPDDPEGRGGPVSMTLNELVSQNGRSIDTVVVGNVVDGSMYQRPHSALPDRTLEERNARELRIVKQEVARRQEEMVDLPERQIEFAQSRLSGLQNRLAEMTSGTAPVTSSASPMNRRATELRNRVRPTVVASAGTSRAAELRARVRGPVVASLRARVHPTAVEPITAATRPWNVNLHPRGKDGKFIEKLGFVKFASGVGRKQDKGKVIGVKKGKNKDGMVLSVEKDDGSIVEKLPSEVSSTAAPKAFMEKMTPEEKKFESELAVKRSIEKTDARTNKRIEESRAALEKFIPEASRVKPSAEKSSSEQDNVFEDLARNVSEGTDAYFEISDGNDDKARKIIRNYLSKDPYTEEEKVDIDDFTDRIFDRLKSNAESDNTANDEALSTRLSDVASAQKPFAKLRKGDRVVIDKDGRPTEFLVESNRNGKVYGNTVSSEDMGGGKWEEEYYEDGITERDIISPEKLNTSKTSTEAPQSDSSDDGPVEVAYRKPGEPFARKTFKSQAAYEAWYDKNEDDIEEVRFADDPPASNVDDFSADTSYDENMAELRDELLNMPGTDYNPDEVDAAISMAQTDTDEAAQAKLADNLYEWTTDIDISEAGDGQLEQIDSVIELLSDLDAKKYAKKIEALKELVEAAKPDEDEMSGDTSP